ncbi:hypothetical protein M409DRAFT_30543 [Zasmidium cellare ATCC 36951]|uniref:AB hydrolase-1 domain-containing protein n=1 Tax=Zasmidium cellare ATCC 36951 TaxID=1080233 RepID=A0A6A6BY66_ZASCE|nr:uncharacterized protein M409DRAFT_30543 [Zasmidium cellare ATCC 36951]KAF2159008.1 hypothetical protein M409DRAFT_30543 [Zasmidium cellare ATCC 36951]
MDLPSTFAHNGWNVKYGVFEPQTTETQNLQTVLFVHGTPWSSEVHIPLAKALLSTKRYRVILYDLPGYGQSQEVPRDISSEGSAMELFKLDMQMDTSVKAQGAALAALIEHLNLTSPPCIIAHDIAGAIVLRTHLIHDIDFASLMLLETNTVLPWGDGFYRLARERPEAFVEMPPAIFEAVVRAVIRSASHDPETFPSTWEDTLAKPWTQDGKAWRQRSFVRQIAQANDEDVKEMLDQDLYSKVRCDVKIVWGESDQWIPKAMLEKLGEMLGERMKEFVVVPEAGHLVMIDQPETIAVETLEWLSKTSASY